MLPQCVRLQWREGSALRMEELQKLNSERRAPWLFGLHILHIIPCLGAVILHSRNPVLNKTQNGMGDSSECLLFSLLNFLRRPSSLSVCHTKKQLWLHGLLPSFGRIFLMALVSQFTSSADRLYLQNLYCTTKSVWPHIYVNIHIYIYIYYMYLFNFQEPRFHMEMHMIFNFFGLYNSVYNSERCAHLSCIV